jgi:hypothetical protein
MSARLALTTLMNFHANTNNPAPSPHAKTFTDMASRHESFEKLRDRSGENSDLGESLYLPCFVLALDAT